MESQVLHVVFLVRLQGNRSCELLSELAGAPAAIWNRPWAKRKGTGASETETESPVARQLRMFRRFPRCQCIVPSTPRWETVSWIPQQSLISVSIFPVTRSFSELFSSNLFCFSLREISSGFQLPCGSWLGTSRWLGKVSLRSFPIRGGTEAGPDRVAETDPDAGGDLGIHYQLIASVTSWLSIPILRETRFPANRQDADSNDSLLFPKAMISPVDFNLALHSDSQPTSDYKSPDYVSVDGLIQ